MKLTKKEMNQLNNIIPKKYNKEMAIIIENNKLTFFTLYKKGIAVFKISVNNNKLYEINIYGLTKENLDIFYETLEYLITIGLTGIYKKDTYL